MTFFLLNSTWKRKKRKENLSREKQNIEFLVLKAWLVQLFKGIFSAMLSSSSKFCALQSHIKLMLTTHRYISFQRHILLNALLTQKFGSTLNFQTFLSESSLVRKSWDLMYTETPKPCNFGQKSYFFI